MTISFFAKFTLVAALRHNSVLFLHLGTVGYSISMASTADASGASSEQKKPIVIITIGMAGAGKSTFVQRINSYLHSKEPPSPPYVFNLDPAVANTPFEANIDIRDTVDYHKVMKEFVSFLPRVVLNDD